MAADGGHLQEVAHRRRHGPPSLAYAGGPSREGILKDASAQAFPKDRRLRKRREFVRIQETGSRVTLPSAIVLLSARTDDGPPRLGVTVTRKFGNAVARNRAKRLFRELFRRSSTILPSGVDFVVIPKNSARGALSLARLHEEWSRAAGLLGARADSLRRALANTAATPQTATPKGPHR